MEQGVNRLTGMWDEFSYFRPVVDKVAAKWTVKLAGRYDFDELKNECVLAYSEIYFFIEERKMPRSDFVKLLWTSCNNRIVDILRKNKFAVNIDDVQVQASSKEFDELFRKLWMEYVTTKLSKEALEVLRTVLDDTKELERVHEVRRANSRYNTQLRREDLNKLFIGERGWTWGRLNRVVKEIREVLQEV